MESKYKRVALIGASGVGKTTLAKYLSTEFELPYLNTSSSDLWEQFGFFSHEDVQMAVYENPQKLYKLQEKILEIRNANYFSRTSFITDRSPIDQCAYFLNYFQISNPIDKFSFINRLKPQANKVDAYIFVRYNNEIIENDGKRIIDPLYQLGIDSLMGMVIDKNLLDIDKPLLVLDKFDWSYRLDKCLRFLVR